MTISTAVSSLVAILRLSILTRFLDKSDFGIVAVVSFILGLTSMFSDMGFSTVILHKQDIDRKQFSSLFWIQMFVYCLLYLMVVSLTYPIATFYNEPLLHTLLPLALLDLLFLGVGRMYETVLQKNFQFKIIAVRNIISCIVSLLLAIIMAVMGFGVYTLVISTLFATIFLACWNFIVGQKHIKLMWYCEVKNNIPLFKIGLYQTGTQIVDYFCTKLDVLIIGKLLGMEVLGVYNLSKEFIFKILSMIFSIGNRVLSPAFAKIQNNLERLRNAYCNSLQLLTSITFPAILAVFVLSSPLISVLYGTDYLSSAPLTSILAIAALGTAIGNPVRNIIVATGRTDLTFYYVWIRAFVTIPCVYLSALHSIQMVAYGQIVLALFDLLLQWRMEIKPTIHLGFTQMMLSLKNNAIMMVVIGVIVLLMFSYVPIGIANPLLQLIIFGIIISLLYLFMYYCFFRKDLDMIISMIKSVIK
ncbi:MAG: MOP flippase family protein [Bacteroidales bacterium]|nr:MOP flippase family protein [Bacteroidales bacterium]